MSAVFLMMSTVVKMFSLSLTLNRSYYTEYVQKTCNSAQAIWITFIMLLLC